MTGSTFKLAVIVNCYNYAEYVGRSVRSVLAQGRSDCELIVVDDGSTDASWEVIGQTGVTAYRIENSGQRRACAFGLDRTTAPFVLFLDADDELAPGALDAIIPHLQPSIAKLQFCLSRIDGNNNHLGSAVPEPELLRTTGDLRERVRKTGAYISPPTSGNVFRRDLCELLHDAEYDNAVDGIIILAAPFFGEVVSLPEELGLYRVHGRNMSGVGRTIDADKIEQHMQRFKNLIEHLNRVMPNDAKPRQLDVERTFFYLEKKMILASINGRMGRYRQIPKLVRIIIGEYFSPARKFALSLFHILIALLPFGISRHLIEIRYRPELRTVAALTKTVIRNSG
ncbi:glycosyltransferase family 2 protein [Bosea sp. F3-2]|uniref:glycosyltransferase family 2 protein n=1 Tax=Bosea sp. F3-2 TaxID=2599640 RepID=UPI0011EF9E2F|nr:glycosyltransferase family 2 protein [Bosea sp. F3-2]QEL23783.1 glycosyltransferase family 2 protein [Bosea sp. F3-2]